MAMALLSEPITFKDIKISPWENPDLEYAHRLTMADKHNKFTEVEASAFLAQPRSRFYLVEQRDGDVMVKLGFLLFVYDKSLGGFLLHYLRDGVAFKSLRVDVASTLIGAKKAVEHFFDFYGEDGIFATQHVFNKGSIALCKRLGFEKIGQYSTATGLLNLWVKLKGDN
jgi:hypothetical protein